MCFIAHSLLGSMKLTHNIFFSFIRWILPQSFIQTPLAKLDSYGHLVHPFITNNSLRQLAEINIRRWGECDATLLVFRSRIIFISSLFLNEKKKSSLFLNEKKKRKIRASTVEKKKSSLFLNEKKKRKIRASTVEHRIFISRLETESFVFFFSRFICSRICQLVQLVWLFSSRFTRSTNMSNQISQIRVTAKNLRNKSKLFFVQFFSHFLRASVASH